MIGQEKLLEKLTSYTLETLPRTILFLGEVGCGKHFLSKELSKFFNVDLIEISSEINDDQLVEYQQSPVDTFYLINLDLFTEKQQNQFLKFIEEPAKNVYIILIASSELIILPTILNRCFKYYFSPYSIEQLKNITGIENDLIYALCNTPGQILSLDSSQVDKSIDFATFFIEDLFKKPMAQILAYGSRLNYKEDYDKIDYRLFLKAVLYIAFKKYLETEEYKYLYIYTFTTQYCQQLSYKIIIKENFITNYLIKMKENLND